MCVALSLARFEQDPMAEALNLWSPFHDNNLCLSLRLHRLQKQVNRAKLAAMVEQTAVRCVNEVGVDLNYAAENQHLHILLSFLSGLGPITGPALVQRLQAASNAPACRSTLMQESYLGKSVYVSTSSFVKMVPRNLSGKPHKSMTDHLDRSRVQLSFYVAAQKLAWDAVYQG